MFSLDSKLSADTFFVTDLKVSRVLLMNNANFPWLILVPREQGATELTDLDFEKQTEILREINLVAKVLQKKFVPHKINIGALGNVVRQLHIHVIARFENDVAFPKPVWGEASKAYEAVVAEGLVSELKDLLSDEGGVFKFCGEGVTNSVPAFSEGVNIGTKFCGDGVCNPVPNFSEGMNIGTGLQTPSPQFPQGLQTTSPQFPQNLQTPSPQGFDSLKHYPLPLTTLQKQLIYRSIHRGCKETDFLIGEFAKAKLSEIKDLEQFDKFLQEDDMLLYDWILGKVEVEQKYEEIVRSIREFHKI